jgi:hypothetical protein
MASRFLHAFWGKCVHDLYQRSEGSGALQQAPQACKRKPTFFTVGPFGFESHVGVAKSQEMAPVPWITSEATPTWSCHLQPGLTPSSLP